MVAVISVSSISGQIFNRILCRGNKVLLFLQRTSTPLFRLHVCLIGFKYTGFRVATTIAECYFR